MYNQNSIIGFYGCTPNFNITNMKMWGEMYKAPCV